MNTELTCPECCRELGFPKPAGELRQWYDCRVCGVEWSPRSRTERIASLLRRQR